MLAKERLRVTQVRRPAARPAYDAPLVQKYRHAVSFREREGQCKQLLQQGAVHLNALPASPRAARGRVVMLVRVGVNVGGVTLWRSQREVISVFGSGAPKIRAEIGDWVRLKRSGEIVEGQLISIDGGRFRVRIFDDGSCLWRAFADFTLPGEDAPKTAIVTEPQTANAAAAQSAQPADRMSTYED